MLRLIPAPLHRLALPIAHRVRHHWRGIVKTPLVGCNIVISDLEGSVLLLRHSYGPKVWCLPGGGVGRREDPIDAARREVREELQIKLESIKLVTELQETISGSPHTTYLFAATTDQRPRADRREILEARFFPRHSLPQPQGDMTQARLDAWRAATKGRS